MFRTVSRWDVNRLVVFVHQFGAVCYCGSALEQKAGCSVEKYLGPEVVCARQLEQGYSSRATSRGLFRDASHHGTRQLAPITTRTTVLQVSPICGPAKCTSTLRDDSSPQAEPAAASTYVRVTSAYRLAFNLSSYQHVGPGLTMCLLSLSF